MESAHREQELETYIDKSNLSIVVEFLLPTYYDAHVKLMDVFSARVVLQFNQRIFVSVGFFCEKAHTYISSNRWVFLCSEQDHFYLVVVHFTFVNRHPVNTTFQFRREKLCKHFQASPYTINFALFSLLSAFCIIFSALQLPLYSQLTCVLERSRKLIKEIWGSQAIFCSTMFRLKRKSEIFYSLHLFGEEFQKK